MELSLDAAPIARGKCDKAWLRYARRYLRETSREFGLALQPVPLDSWPSTKPEERPARVWRSRHFCVQE